MLRLKRHLLRALVCSVSGLVGGCSGADKEADVDAIGISDAGSEPAPDAAPEACLPITRSSDPIKPPVDLVWILDGSPSMLPHALALGANMPRFIETVRGAGADIQVVMLTGFSFGPLLQRSISDADYHWAPVEVQNHDAFAQGVAAYDDYAQYLRARAPTHFIVLSDDASDSSARDFLAQLSEKHERPFFVHAIAAEGDFASGGKCAGAGAGTEYFAAADATMGDKISLCADWPMNFERLQARVIESVAPEPCAYPLPAPPPGQTLEPDALQVLFRPRGAAAEELPKAASAARCGVASGWYFEDAPAPERVLLCPEACTTLQRGGALEIGFGCAPTRVLQ